MLFAVLAFAAIVLTLAMFLSKQSMLGFPCTIFWAILGGYCYQHSTTTWDIYYLTFFGSIGVAIFCSFAAFALRTKKEELVEGDEYIDEGKDDIKFIDEGGSSSPKQLTSGVEDNPSRRRKEIRERADNRRSR